MEETPMEEGKKLQGKKAVITGGAAPPVRGQVPEMTAQN
jgi:hypothetical protein